MRVEPPVTAKDVIKEMETFLKELRLSGYKVHVVEGSTFSGEIFLVGDGYRQAHVMMGSKNGRTFNHILLHERWMDGKLLEFETTEELEKIIMEFIHDRE